MSEHISCFDENQSTIERVEESINMELITYVPYFGETLIQFSMKKIPIEVVFLFDQINEHCCSSRSSVIVKMNVINHRHCMTQNSCSQFGRKFRCRRRHEYSI